MDSDLARLKTLSPSTTISNPLLRFFAGIRQRTCLRREQARGRQLATLDRLAHDRIADPDLGRLLDRLQARADEADTDSDGAGSIRVTRRDHERAAKVPAAFVSEFANHRAESYERWAKARPKNDFAAVRPMLEKTVELSRRYAGFFAPYEHVADPLIEHADPGMKTSGVRALFAELRAELVPLVKSHHSAATRRRRGSSSQVSGRSASSPSGASGREVRLRLYARAPGQDAATRS